MIADLIKAGARIWDDRQRQKIEDEKAAHKTEEQLLLCVKSGSPSLRTREHIAAEKELMARNPKKYADRETILREKAKLEVT